MSKPLSLLGASLLAAAVPAQLTVVDGNMNVTTGALSATAHTPRSLALRADAIAVDHGFEHWWYYRVAGDTRESALRNVGGVAEGIVGEHVNRDFADVDARNLLKAAIDMHVYAAGPASGVLISRVTFTNRSNAPVTLDVFCYTDLDIADTFGNDVCTGSASSHFVTDPSGVQIEVRALGSDRSAVGPYPTIRDLLTNATVDNLPLQPPPFSGDYSGAFQWQNRTLQPFEQRTFTVALAVDTAAAALPLVENYGAGNSSTFEIHTVSLPLQDQTQTRVISSEMKGALPGVEHRTIIGLDPWQPQPFIPGLDLWVLPASIVGVYGGLTNAAGEAFELFVIPPSPYLAGFDVYFQVFSVSAAAPNGYAYFSAGMHMRIGKL